MPLDVRRWRAHARFIRDARLFFRSSVVSFGGLL